MTGRDIVLANIWHNDPPRAGLTFNRGRINDMVFSGPDAPKGYTPKRWMQGNIEYYDDMWGNIWKRMIGGSVKGEIHSPTIDDWRELDKLEAPNFDSPACWATMKEEFSKPTDKFKLACIGGWIFDNARYLRKLEVYLLDMAMSPDQLHRLHKIVAQVYETKIHHSAKCHADGIMIGEDMGTQSGLLFSPTMWRDYFQKEYTRLFSLAHDYGLKIFMHSCGQNWQILPDLLKAGVDCFQFDQPTVYDMPALAELLTKHHAALWSPIDIQKILPTGDRRIIEDGAREMCRTFRGGLIVTSYGDLPGIGVEEMWDQWAYQAVLTENTIAIR